MKTKDVPNNIDNPTKIHNTRSRSTNTPRFTSHPEKNVYPLEYVQPPSPQLEQQRRDAEWITDLRNSSPQDLAPTIEEIAQSCEMFEEVTDAITVILEEISTKVGTKLFTLHDKKPRKNLQETIKQYGKELKDFTNQVEGMSYKNMNNRKYKFHLDSDDNLQRISSSPPIIEQRANLIKRLLNSNNPEISQKVHEFLDSYKDQINQTDPLPSDTDSLLSDTENVESDSQALPDLVNKVLEKMKQMVVRDISQNFTAIDDKPITCSINDIIAGNNQKIVNDYTSLPPKEDLTSLTSDIQSRLNLDSPDDRNPLHSQVEQIIAQIQRLQQSNTTSVKQYQEVQTTLLHLIEDEISKQTHILTSYSRERQELENNARRHITKLTLRLANHPDNREALDVLHSHEMATAEESQIQTIHHKRRELNNKTSKAQSKLESLQNLKNTLETLHFSIPLTHPLEQHGDPSFQTVPMDTTHEPDDDLMEIDPETFRRSKKRSLYSQSLSPDKSHHMEKQPKPRERVHWPPDPLLVQVRTPEDHSERVFGSHGIGTPDDPYNPLLDHVQIRFNERSVTIRPTTRRQYDAGMNTTEIPLVGQVHSHDHANQRTASDDDANQTHPKIQEHILTDTPRSPSTNLNTPSENRESPSITHEVGDTDKGEVAYRFYSFTDISPTLPSPTDLSTLPPRKPPTGKKLRPNPFQDRVLVLGKQSGHGKWTSEQQNKHKFMLELTSSSNYRTSSPEEQGILKEQRKEEWQKVKGTWQPKTTRDTIQFQTPSNPYAPPPGYNPFAPLHIPDSHPTPQPMDVTSQPQKRTSEVRIFPDRPYSSTHPESTPFPATSSQNYQPYAAHIDYNPFALPPIPDSHSIPQPKEVVSPPQQEDTAMVENVPAPESHQGVTETQLQEIISQLKRERKVDNNLRKIISDAKGLSDEQYKKIIYTDGMFDPTKPLKAHTYYWYILRLKKRRI